MRLPSVPAVEYERLANPPLRAMLGQVQFPAILKLQKGLEVVADFQDAIRETFPTFAVEQQIQLTVAGGNQNDATLARTTAYRFTNSAETWSVVLGASALTLEAVAGGKYSSYEEFSSLFRHVWSAAVEAFNPGRINRQGLRYVDHVEGTRPPAAWTEWINPELLGGMARGVLGSQLSRTLCELTYELQDGRIIFRHGISPAGPEAVEGYLLDVDSIHNAPIESQDVEAVMSRFDESHDVLYRMFRWSITGHALEEFRRGA